jgi:hypothetical protein
MKSSILFLLVLTGLALMNGKSGYTGLITGTEFVVVEGIPGRRFPIFPDDNPESKPTGRIRQIQYKLHPGEAGWLRKPDKVMNFQHS